MVAGCGQRIGTKTAKYKNVDRLHRYSYRVLKQVVFFIFLCRECWAFILSDHRFTPTLVFQGSLPTLSTICKHFKFFLKISVPISFSFPRFCFSLLELRGKIVKEASLLSRDVNRRATLSPRDIQSATRLVLKGELASLIRS